MESCKEFGLSYFSVVCCRCSLGTPRHILVSQSTPPPSNMYRMPGKRAIPQVDHDFHMITNSNLMHMCGFLSLFWLTMPLALLISPDLSGDPSRVLVRTQTPKARTTRTTPYVESRHAFQSHNKLNGRTISCPLQEKFRTTYSNDACSPT